jgi:hypothetical protein
VIFLAEELRLGPDILLDLVRRGAPAPMLEDLESMGFPVTRRVLLFNMILILTVFTKTKETTNAKADFF